MKPLILTLLLLATGTIASAQHAFNQRLADSLGADQYGMKKYVLVMLKTGKTKVSKVRGDSLFQGHMANIDKLAAAGQLVAAGPLAKNTRRYEGIFILNVKTTDEAIKLLKTDPAIRAGLLETECYSWYGSAALPLYLKFHDQVKKTDF
ncbi:YCII-related domain-containing protein [Mucilaginibacter pineti]|uniref:YCII-related domain-containing protein n=1 Tax=Mucilaginibacter pineti TaxID=1391627 RepID=A0A1G7EKF6_9SPHI|nr:YciI family protein [Mucilaginibacter pineti]SDE63876.1 YCII-related domain-containing protein [Mucilaginibacter pineti]